MRELLSFLDTQSFGTETGPKSEMGQTEKWRRIRRESALPRTTDIDRLRAKIMIYAQNR